MKIIKWAIAFYLLQLSIFAASSAVEVLSPKTFVRTTAAPVADVVSFSAPVAKSGYTLTVVNGASGGGAVSSAEISLNGTVLFSANDFKNKPATLLKTVALLNQNTLAVTVKGKPGDQLAVSVYGENLDNELPLITATAVPAANASGWNNSVVTVSFQCSDAGSGIASCTAPSTVSTEGAGQPITGTATDNAGNTATTTATVNLDKTAPTIASALSAPANAKGWHKADVTVTFACNDALSGMDQCPTPVTVSTESAGQSVSGKATDLSGNEATSATLNVKLDKTSPTLAITSPAAGALLTNAVPSIQISYQDNLSIDKSSVALLVNGATVPVTCQWGTGTAQCVPSSALPSVASTLAVHLSDDAGNIAVAQVAINFDSDADGVADSHDQCPATTAGQTVDANGCSAEQRDTDGDGVKDALDQCVSTPTGAAVDANGCSAAQRDSDGDGVNDAIDQCADTASGDTPDAQGCGLSQRDDDADGVLNPQDQCQDTPTGEAVDSHGCSDSQRDTDGDGIKDASDACANTPPGAGVDSRGCASTQRDTDTDGVSDALDQCAGSPAGEPVDANGCAVAQRDDDGDGIANGQDHCLSTVTGTRVEADGCDETQRDTDGDGVMDINDAFPNDPARHDLPFVTIDTPASLTTVGHTPLAITGRVDAAAQALTVNGTPVSIQSDHTYAANVALEQGHNTVVARMVDNTGLTSTASIAVSLDMTPPYLTVESHTDGQIVTTPTIAVTGLINDIVRGTIEDDQAVVTVNGVQAAVSNRSYLANNVPVVEGENTLIINGSDQVGNSAQIQLKVIYRPTTGQHLEVVSGQNQSAVLQQALPQPLVVRVLDDQQHPVADKNVVFRVVQDSGTLTGTSLSGRGVVEKTNAQGLAQVRFTLGLRSGVGNQKVRARVVGYDDEAVFVASAQANVANKLSVNSGQNQRGGNFQPLPAPFVVVATDEGANVVAGARVEFKVDTGHGYFYKDENGVQQDSITVATDTDGRASAQLTLGGVLGLDQQRVTATLLDGPAGETLTAGFTASAFVPGEAGLTTITGMVVDNQDNPLPGTTIRVEGTSRQVQADAQGRFSITEAPVGPVHLIADGSTTTVPGEYPSLSYNIVTVSGVENPLATPIYMVKLNTDSAQLAGREDVSITLPEVPGFKLDIKQGSVTFPDGSKEGKVSVTVVNSEKMPMLPPNGMQPQLIVTIQPTGTMFDPPARLTLPNVDGHAPGRQVEMFSYDHDLEEFVAIGLGTVSEDATTITSNPGVGVIKAGWHCGAQPGGSGCCTGGDDCAKCYYRDGSCTGNCKKDPECCEEEPDPEQCEKCEHGEIVPITPPDKCCDGADWSNADVAGTVMCCNGDTVICTRPGTNGGGSWSDRVFNECRQQHEEVHTNQLHCEDDCDNRVPNWPPNVPQNEGECEAYQKSNACFDRYRDGCGSDQVCKDNIDAQIKLGVRQMEINCP